MSLSSRIGLFAAVVLSAGGMALAAIAGAEDQPTVRQGVYEDTCDEQGQAEDTKITKGPKNKTDKTKAKFAFVGFYCVTGEVDDQSNYEFECKLDKGKFKDCSSPQTYRNLDKGKHKFSVFAHFQNSDGDPTPATDKWKITD